MCSVGFSLPSRPIPRSRRAGDGSRWQQEANRAHSHREGLCARLASRCHRDPSPGRGELGMVRDGSKKPTEHIVIEKDYVLGWLLAAIANHPQVEASWGWFAMAARSQPST